MLNLDMMKKIVAFSLIFSLFLSAPVFPALTYAQATVTQPLDMRTLPLGFRVDNLGEPILEPPHMVELRTKIIDVPDHILYTAYTMERHRLLQEAGWSNENGSFRNTHRDTFRPRHQSPLSYERSKGMPLMRGDAGLDLLTGQVAIDEALQLGSIGISGPGEESEARSIPITSVTPLEIESHPWEEMKAGKEPIIKPITHLVPSDTLFIHFKDPPAILEMEKVLLNVSDVFGDFYNLSFAQNIRSYLLSELGIDNQYHDFSKWTEELGVVLYDVNLFTSTDFALIFKPSNTVSLSQLTANLDNNKHGQLGDFYVIASNEKMYESIRNTHQTGDGSLAKSGDYRYTTTVLQSDYDGFVFISDDLVRKLTSPQYRLATRRHNASLNALETLQYSVFGYRYLTGNWPTSISSMIQEGYISNNVTEPERYTVRENGVVWHDTYGSIYEPISIAEVDIDLVTPAEVTIYENFVETYQQMWVEFIDPVGITIKVDDHIQLHTIILPLVEQSQYNWLRAITGREPVEISFISAPDIQSFAQFASRFHLEDIVTLLFEMSPWLLMENDELLTEDGSVDTQEAMRLVDEVIREGLNWRRPEGPLSFIGNEITVGLSIPENDDLFSELSTESDEYIESKINDAFFDHVYFGLEITDSETAQRFFSTLGNTFSGMNRRSALNRAGEYQSVPYFSIDVMYNQPIYITFLDDRLYIAPSLRTIERLIIGNTHKNITVQDNVNHLFYHLRAENNLAFYLDMETIAPLWSLFFKEQQLSGFGVYDFQVKRSYLNEMQTLASSLSDETKLDLAKSEPYYRYAPTDWFGNRFEFTDNTFYISTDKGRFKLNDIDASLYFHRFMDQDESKIHMEEIVTPKDSSAFISTLKSFGIGFRFTPDGLDIRIALDNPNRLSPSDRESPFPISKAGSDTYERVFMWIAGVILVLFIIFAFSLVYKRRHTLNNTENEETQ